MSLKVLQIIANLQHGGVERHLTVTLPALARRGVDPHVCCLSGEGPYGAQLRQLGIPIWSMRRSRRFDPTLIPQMVRLLSRHRFDVVHTLNFTANTWGRIAARLARVPWIVAHERGTAWTQTRLMRRIDRRLHRFADLILANSHAARIMMVQRVGLPPERIRVVYNGVPPPPECPAPGPSLRRRLGIEPGVPLIGMVGRLDTPKGHPFLLAAIPYVWRTIPEAHFVIVGDGPLGPELRAQMAEQHLLGDRRCQLSGFVEDIPARMAELDILVHPAIREALGNVLLEAGMAGVPAIATDVDGCAEIVRHGETGLLVPGRVRPRSNRSARGSPLPEWVVDGQTRSLRPPRGPAPTELAQQIVALLRDAPRRRQLGRAARSRVQSRFGMDAYVRNLLLAYRGVL